jgi:hypothetical protein
MAQTILSTVVEVDPRSAEVLRGLISTLRDDQSALTPAYAGLRKVQTLHFLSMTVFADDQYDPIFVIEANFDGDSGPFWAGLEAAIGPELRAMLRCCKRPRGKLGLMFDAITAPGGSAPVAPLLEARTIKPAVFHQGNRGLTRERIEREAQLFLDLRTALEDPTRFQGRSAVEVHQTLRAEFLPARPWLNPPAPAARIGLIESLADWARLIGFGALVLLVLHGPGVMLALAVPPWPALAAIVVTAVALGLILRGLAKDETDPVKVETGSNTKSAPPWRMILIGLVALAAFEALLVAIINGFVVWRTGSSDFAVAGVVAGLGLAGVAPVALGLLVWIRLLERADPMQDEPPVDPRILREIMTLEDKVAQNHMGSVVHVKPGVLRTASLRAALCALGLVLRVQARSGYLGSMRTIHFAHWALVSNGGRLMFFSNFDGSWESYLDDFIEKAHAGLTLAWTSGVGFPSTRFLIFDGATQGRLFKAWARHSMAPSLFWFSGYRVLSVNQIERQARIAEGLRKPTLSPKEAAQWATDL